MEEVVILLSTYNGEKYLDEQLNSILNQKQVQVKIIVRDDGSTDGTLDVLKKYESDVVVVHYGRNVGYKESFMRLMELAPLARYYAFSDQDDVWHEDKLIVAVEQLKKYENVPAVYSSSQRLVDSEMNYLGDFIEKPITELGAAIVKNYVVGCTTVFNQKLMKEVKKFKSNRYYSHDWLVNVIALSFGGVSIFDQTSHINYRQHNNNSVGAEVGFLKKWNGRIERFLYSQHHRECMCADILNNYENRLNREESELLSIFRDYKKNKISLMFNRGVKTTRLSYRICFLIMIICEKL